MVRKVDSLYLLRFFDGSPKAFLPRLRPASQWATRETHRRPHVFPGAAFARNCVLFWTLLKFTNNSKPRILSILSIHFDLFLIFSSIAQKIKKALFIRQKVNVHSSKIKKALYLRRQDDISHRRWRMALDYS